MRLRGLLPDMKKFWELFQQQDGASCALQFAVVVGFVLFWGTWVYVSFYNKVVSEVPVGAGGLLAAMLAAKVWKDKVDNTVSPTLPG